MNHIEKLIEELCPDGVRRIQLSQLVGKVDSIVWGEDAETATYIDLSSVDMRTGRILETELIDETTAPSRARQLVCKNDVLFATTRPLQGRKTVIASNPETVLVASTGFAVLRLVDDRLLPQFLFHMLGSLDFRKHVEAWQQGTGYPSVSDKNVKRFRIPVPPLEVQREIVKVLDLFTKLEAELEAELVARRKQYEYYRDQLLTFPEDGGAPWVELGDIATYINGKAHEKVAGPRGEVALITARFISRGGEANRWLDAKDVLTPALKGDVSLVLSDLPKGKALARTYFVRCSGSFAVNQRVAILRVKDRSQVQPRFLSFVLDRNRQLLQFDNGTDQTHLKKRAVQKVRIPLPPVSEQKRIADILDTFDALVNDLESGLPAEIEARRKQYEYYRDKLLTFKELEPSA